MLQSLTGLRFFAAFHVLLFHALAGVPAAGAYTWFRPVVATGYIAVSFFFVLSGFILVYAYRDPLEAGGFDRVGFSVARWARIYPLYLVGLLASLPILRGHLTGDLGHDAGLVGSILLGVQAFFPPYAGGWNPPAWSVSAELSFYFAFLWLAPRAMKLSARGAVVGMAGAYAVALLASGAYIALTPDGVYPVGPDHELFWLNFLKYSPLVRGLEFVLGVCLGRLYLCRGEPVPRAGVWTGTVLGLLGIAVYTGSWLPYPLVHNALYAPLFAGLIYLLATSDTAVGRALSHPALVAVGLSSYALYILHTPLLSLFSGVGRRLGVAWSLPVIGIVCVVIVGLTLPAHRFIEEPARRFLRRQRPPRR